MKAAGALALAVVLLAGCVRAGSRTHDSQTLTIVQQREPLSLNPAMDNGTSSTEWGLLLFSYLVKFDDRGRLVGDAATEVPSLANGGIGRDGRTITYHLRAGLRFSDGVPLTARDCVWSIRAIQNRANDVQSRYGYDRVVLADAPDDRTLVLHLKAPFAPLTTIVLAPQGFPILPAHVLSKYPNFNKLAFNGAPVGSGPYVVRSWDRGDRVELHANPYYFRGKPKIDRIVVRFVADSTTAIDQLRTGEADGFFNDQDLGNYPALRAVPGVRTTSRPMNAVGALIFNTRDPLTADVRVRRALAEAIDIATTVAKAYRGALDARQAGRGLFIWAYDPAAYPDVAYDPARAARLLDAAGWVRGSDGVRRKGGRSLDLLLIVQAATPGDAVVANVIAKAEEAIGARVEIKAFSANQFVAPASLGGPVYGGHFQMALYPFVNGDDPDTSDQFLCDRVPPNGYNKSRICDPRLDALLVRARETNDVAARKALYVRVEQRLFAELPIVLLDQSRQVSAFTNRLSGQTTSLSGAFWNVGSWTLST